MTKSRRYRERREKKERRRKRAQKEADSLSVMLAERAEKRDPKAIPHRARAMAKETKWYHMRTEKILLSVTS